jgi:DNA polymerase I-like protein with 3'-5' exonuclease and polymerase domains
MDFRIFAHYVKNPKVLTTYANDPNTDFHQLCADITGLPRSPRFAGDPNAKQINLGLVFGMGQGKLAAEMGLPYTIETDNRGKEWLRPGQQATDVFNTYHSNVQGVKEMLENATAVAKSRGFVRTIMGRHIRFPKGMFTHKAGGLIFQGSAADALKVKIIQLDSYYEEAKGDKGYLCLNVHDEFDSIVPRGRDDVRMEVSRIVTDFHSEDQPIKFRVPIVTDQGFGANWWEACK